VDLAAWLDMCVCVCMWRKMYGGWKMGFFILLGSMNGTFSRGMVRMGDFINVQEK
jgi:hypothetical protein